MRVIYHPDAEAELLEAAQFYEGRVSGLERLNKSQDGRDVAIIVEALSRGRLEPAQFGGSPVAVNLVWLVAHIYFLINFRNRLVVMLDWAWAYFTYQRYARIIMRGLK